jgi:hypothetical protein
MMIGFMRLAAGRTWLTGALVVALVSGLRADVESDYGRGWTAYKQGNWRAVIEAMTAAIAQRPAEQGHINIGSNNNQPYLPHYYLGLARFRLGDCPGALDAWRKSLEQKYLRRFRQEDEQFSKFFPICEKQVEIEGDLSAARTTLAALDALARDPNLAKSWSSEPALGPAVAKAGQTLAGAEAEYQSARQEREERRITALTAARSLSAGVRKQVDGLDQSIRSRQQTLAADARARQQQEAARLAAANSEKTTAPPAPGGAPFVGTLSSGATSGGATSGATLPRLDLGAASPPPSASKPAAPASVERAPQQLRAGIERFVTGRYRDALDALATVQSSPAWNAQAALFRAAASFSLYRATQEPQWRTRALDAARQGARLDPNLQVDDQLLSPAFRRFFADAVRTDTVAAGSSR